MMFVRREADAEPIDLSGEGDLKGVELRPLIAREQGARRLAMRIFRLEPGGYTPFHEHEWEHEVFVLEGTGQVIGAEETLAIEAGVAVYVGPGEKHRFRAGERGLVFLCCIPILP